MAKKQKTIVVFELSLKSIMHFCVSINFQLKNILDTNIIDVPLLLLLLSVAFFSPHLN